MRSFVQRFAVSSRGNVAMIFALTLPVLVMITMGGVDLNRASTVRVNLQDALDAATLAVARSTTTKEDELNDIGNRALAANLQGYGGVTLASATFKLDANQVVVADAKVNVKTLVANIVLPPYGKLLDDTLPVTAHSEVNRATGDVEVALVLDITGSMEGTRLTDLKAAANSLVDEVIKTDQTISKTRIALIPYSMGVNAGAYADTVRGALRGPTTITDASWSASAAKNITAISQASPGVITSNGHGFTSSTYVWISGVSGMTLLNNKPYLVDPVNANTFKLKAWNGSSWQTVNTTNALGYKTYSGNGKATPCQVSTCDVVVTSSGHGMETGQDVRITGVKGMTTINNTVAVDGSNLNWTVTKVSDTKFSLNNVRGALQSNYTSGSGQTQCLESQCRSYLFTNGKGDLRVYDGTNCVTERPGSQAYTSASTSGAPVGLSYTGTTDVATGGCLTSGITPLTSNKTTLHEQINGYTAEGGTAGQIGVAWGWYMLSPAFANIFPEAGQPAAYGTRNLRKVAIIMTDGQFNAIYCNGVRAQNSGVGGGSLDRQINCNGVDPFDQSKALCAAMKAQGVVVYTVGFDIGDAPDTIEVLAECASSAANAFLPSTGASLKSDFATIARGISALRISR